MTKTVITSTQQLGLVIKRDEAIFVSGDSHLTDVTIESGGLMVVDPNAVIYDVKVKTGGRIIVGGLETFIKDLKDDLIVSALPAMHIDRIGWEP